MTVTVINNLKEFQSIIAEDTPVLIDFWAPWCPPCVAISPKVEELAKKEGVVKFYKVNIDDVSDVADEVQISSIPTFIVFKKGEKVDQLQGADRDGLEKLVATANSL